MLDAAEKAEWLPSTSKQFGDMLSDAHQTPWLSHSAL